MRVLVVLAHFFQGKANSIYSSTNEKLRDRRQQSLQSVISQWRSLVWPTSTLDIDTRSFKTTHRPALEMDIVVLIHKDNHLLTQEMVQRFEIRPRNVATDDTRMIPFAAHTVMKEGLNRYDWFIYSEEDLLVHDNLFFLKQQWFQEKFGKHRLLQPHRYEINPRAKFLKTYIDGDLKPSFIDPFLARVEEDEEQLEFKLESTAVRIERTKNPHSGFFFLSQEQLSLWSKKNYFMDLDCSFVGPLESAATLGILKTFSVYKAAEPNMNFFEVQHLDTKFSGMDLPVKTA
jgi:hypothetical protein